MILKVLLTIGTLAVIGAEASNACYAPPLVYGGVCKSKTAIIGHDGARVSYSITPTNNAKPLVCCKARGCGPSHHSSCSGWGMYDIGCSHSSFQAVLPWGSNADHPAIQCYGNPTGTSIEWSH